MSEKPICIFTYGSVRAVDEREGETYTIDTCGNITRIQAGDEGDIRYEYDELNQLIREDNGVLGKTICYTYDLGGNMTSRKEYALTEGNVGALQKEDTFVYRTSGWKDQLLSYNGQTCTYDASGNPTVYRGKNLSWQRGRQLASAEADGQTVSFAYDSSGNRIRKSAGGSVTRYHYSGNSLMALEQGNTQLQFVYDTDGRPFMMRVNGSSDYFYLYNAQGDVTALIDSLNNPVVKYVYDSWGKMVSVTDTSGQGIGTLNPFRYRGYVYDAETGWYYLGSRYYDAETGRFLNADEQETLVYQNESVNGKNLYQYCFNNPVNMVDEAGAWPEWIANVTKVTVAAMAIVGLAAATVMTGGTVAIVCGAALTGAIVGGSAGAIIGASMGGINEVCNGILAGSLIGAVAGSVMASTNIGTGMVKIVGKAQSTHTFFHKATSNLKAGQMAMQIGKYSEIYLDRSLKTANLIGRKRPDIIGIARFGKNLLVEVTSKSQTST